MSIRLETLASGIQSPSPDSGRRAVARTRALASELGWQDAKAAPRLGSRGWAARRRSRQGLPKATSAASLALTATRRVAHLSRTACSEPPQFGQTEPPVGTGLVVGTASDCVWHGAAIAPGTNRAQFGQAEPLQALFGCRKDRPSMTTT